MTPEELDEIERTCKMWRHVISREYYDQVVAALREAWAERDKTFPLSISKDVLPGPRRIPWSVAEKAYGVYVSKYGRGQTLERLAERGGFYWEEMDDLYPQWRSEVGEIADLKARAEQAEAECERLRALADAVRDVKKHDCDEIIHPLCWDHIMEALHEIDRAALGEKEEADG